MAPFSTGMPETFMRALWEQMDGRATRLIGREDSAQGRRPADCSVTCITDVGQSRPLA